MYLIHSEFKLGSECIIFLKRYHTYYAYPNENKGKKIALNASNLYTYKFSSEMEDLR